MPHATEFTPVQLAARAASDYTLIHVAQTLNAELQSDFAAGVRGTHAHVGKIEMASACSDELVRRGYVRVVNPKHDIPHLVAYECIDGEDTTIRLSQPVLCF